MRLVGLIAGRRCCSLWALGACRSLLNLVLALLLLPLLLWLLRLTLWLLLWLRLPLGLWLWLLVLRNCRGHLLRHGLCDLVLL